ncbi:hypothetical protein AN403_2223 [Pseudomonas fluorescens]|uniref:Uncharacterized protein n=1 Tax=Pseudomonas fluorescens TaxID=294 RepID=A0A0P8ZFI5_PSEFL|nr:hypothetical protein AN403_2223 [Pseudomonas fluorescens]
MRTGQEIASLRRMSRLAFYFEATRKPDRIIDVPGVTRRTLSGYQSRACLLRRHKHRESQIDELFVPADGLQSTPNILGNVI